MENEADFVSVVTPRLISRGVEVHTIALGPWVDQPLLSELASDTGGTYSYVDVGTTVPRMLVNDADTSVGGELAGIYPCSSILPTPIWALMNQQISSSGSRRAGPSGRGAAIDRLGGYGIPSHRWARNAGLE